MNLLNLKFCTADFVVLFFLSIFMKWTPTLEIVLSLLIHHGYRSVDTFISGFNAFIGFCTKGQLYFC